MKLKIQNVLLITIVATMILLSSLNYNIARTSAYVEEYDGLYEIYYDDGNPEFSCYWTYIGARECGFAVRFTPPFTPLLIVGACFYLYDAYDFIVAVYDENRNEIYREEFQVVPEDRGAEDWFSVEFTEPIRIDEGDFYIALILKTPAHPKLGADSTPPYNGRSYWIHEEDGSVVWETGEEVAAEEGWTPSDFCISALVTPLDTDGDGLSDYEEVKVKRTNPNDPDTDKDLIPDGIDLLSPTINNFYLILVAVAVILVYAAYTYGLFRDWRDDVLAFGLSDIGGVPMFLLPESFQTSYDINLISSGLLGIHSMTSEIVGKELQSFVLSGELPIFIRKGNYSIAWAFLKRVYPRLIKQLNRLHQELEETYQETLRSWSGLDLEIEELKSWVSTRLKLREPSPDLSVSKELADKFEKEFE